MKIFYLTELLSPYRIEWMNLLSRGNEITAYYLISEERTRDTRWLADKKPLFRTKQVERSKLFSFLPSRAFSAEVRAGDYDVYLIDGYSSPVKLKILRRLVKKGKKVFINIDGIDVWSGKGRLGFIKDKIKRSVFRSGVSFLCGSRTAADYIIQNGADSERVFVHPFSSLHEGDILTVSQKEERQAAAKKKLGVENEKVALAVGRFIPLKRYDVLIRAWKDMPRDCRLFLIGGGAERESYEALARSLNVENIMMIDFLVPSQLRAYYDAADLFVHTSETETWGLVLNEAMAAGCPVIATNRCVAGVELVREGREGYLTDVGDAEGLHEKMLRILGDDALRGEMRRNVLARIQPYTYEKMAEMHLKLFEDTK